MRQDALTVITNIKPEAVETLRELLTKIGDDVADNALIPFAKLTTVHFLRWVVLDSDKDVHGNAIPPSLALSTDYDGPLDGHLEELVGVAGDGLNLIYANCEGYPADGARTPAAVQQYLMAHRKDYAAFYIGTRGRSVGQIRREGDLRDAIETKLDRRGGCRGAAKAAPSDIRRDIQDFAREQLGDVVDCGNEPAATPNTPSKVEVGLGIAAASLALFALVKSPALRKAAMLAGVAVGAGLLAAAGTLRVKEIMDQEAGDIPNTADVQKLTEREDHPALVQNQLTHIVNVKPGPLRLALLKSVLWAIDVLARYVFNKGALGGIPTIHFARWVFIDNDRRLLFFSNFDGSWENYLGDFIDRAALGLTGVWSNTVGFPKTLFLLWQGAKDEERFKNWTRNHQIPTQVWYSAYPSLTVDNINNNSKIRSGLFGTLNADETAAWLRRF